MAFPENTVNDIGIKHIWDKVNTALSGKVDKVSGKGLSTNDYTTTEKNKLAGIESGAQVNAVTSVAGKTGAVTLDKSDVGLGNADNTSDLDKPISTATQNALNNKADSGEVEGLKTATGNPITLTDCAPINAESLVVELEPKQDLHGQSAPYVGGAGKNKLNVTASTSEIDHVKFTVGSDGSINIKRTDADPDNATFTMASGVVISSAMKFNCGIVPDWNGTGFVVFAESGGQNYEISSIDGVELPSGTYDFKIMVQTGKDPNVTIYPMIRLSTETDPTFAHYSNICPISGYEGVEVEDVGKNLFDKDSADNVIGYWINTNNGALEPSSSGWNTSGYIRVEPSTAYSFTVESSAIDICCFDEAKTFISGALGQSITTPQNCVYIRFDYKESEKNYVQLEKSTTRTPYEPYQSRTASVTFGQTVYGGSVDLTTGVLTVDHVKNVLKNLTKSYFANGTYSTAYSANLPVVSNTVAISQTHGAISNMGIEQVAYWGAPRENEDYSANSPFFAISTTGEFLTVYDNSTTITESDFLTKYNDFEVCYPLATPQTIQLTPTDLKLLQDTNNLSTNGTTINLDYIPNNSIGDAVKASEEYTDRAIERVAVAPKATLIDTWMISEESDTISVDLTSYDCNFFLLEYLFNSKRGTTLIPRPSGGSFSASVVTYNNGTAYYVELTYNPTTKELAYTSNITSQFGILAIYTI